MGALGHREWIGLAALVVAAAIGVMFLNAGVGEPDRSHDSGADAEATATADKGPPGPARPLPKEPSWAYTFVDLREPTPVPRDRAFGSDLDFEFDAAPLPGYADGEWSFVAEWGFEAPQGRYGVRLAYRGTIRIVVDGVVIAEAGPAEQEAMVTAAFGHDGGVGTLRIELIDTAGVASVTWRGLNEPGETADDIHEEAVQP